MFKVPGSLRAEVVLPDLPKVEHILMVPDCACLCLVCLQWLMEHHELCWNSRVAQVDSRYCTHLSMLTLYTIVCIWE